jgi:MYXO-CTERM domain-containing protein
MWTRLAISVPIVIVAIVLTLAPVFAQETRTDAGVNDRTTVADRDETNRPDLGWLGLIGLVGLGGLLRRDRDHEHRTDRPAHK